MSLYNPEHDKLRTYESPEDFFNYLMSLPENCRYYLQSENDVKWAGDTGKDALYKLSQGDRTYLKDAEALLDIMRTEGLLSVGQKLYQTSIVGSYPCVPNFLMGQPDTMYKLVESEISSDKSPIDIYVQLNASGGISVKDLVARGNAILGFVMAMQNIRPINLYAISISTTPKNPYSASGTKIKLPTNPMDLDRALYILGNPSFFRQLCFGQLVYHDYGTIKRVGIPWPWGGAMPHDAEHVNAVREMVNIGEKDIYIPAPHLFNDEYIKNPIGWIKKELAKYTQLD